MKQLIDLREKISKILLGSNNVDRIMTDKVNDYILIEELPLSVLIGSRNIYVGNFTLENDYKFWHMYGKLLAHMQIEFINFDLLNDGVKMYEVISTHKKWYKGMIKIIKKTLLKQQGYFKDQMGEVKKHIWKNCTYRYFKKHITKEKLIQICFLIYLYNFDAVKKNFQIITTKMGASGKQAMENYMYFWLQNLAGLTGKFQDAQLRNVLPLQLDMPNPKFPKKSPKKQKPQEVKNVQKV
jgi:hypothetical protein